MWKFWKDIFFPENISEDAKNLIKMILIKDPKNKINTNMVLKLFF